MRRDYEKYFGVIFSLLGAIMILVFYVAPIWIILHFIIKYW